MKLQFIFTKIKQIEKAKIICLAIHLGTLFLGLLPYLFIRTSSSYISSFIGRFFYFTQIPLDKNSVFFNAFASLQLEYLKGINNHGWCDPLGDVFMDLTKGIQSYRGQFFTPPSICDMMCDVTVDSVVGKSKTSCGAFGKRVICNDPACGTFGFMIAADAYVKAHTDDLFALDSEQQEFQKKEAFTGAELVHETHRLALMNAMLHDIEGKIYLCDTLSNQGKQMNGFDVVLTNPPFGTKKGGERANRDDFTFQTSNKQLNFLQHIYRSLKADGKARAAVVLPDNVLFADGEGERIRKDLMDKCNLHTVLRLPTGIFYAQGVKTNVLFFTRGTTDKGNTKEVWFYDLRTNMPSFGKTNPLKLEHFDGFKAAYTADDRHTVSDERWSCYTYEQIAEEGKNHSLDLGLIRDDSVLDYNDLPDPIESGEECIAQLEEAVDLLMSVVKELKSLESTEV